jgi:hypothetical protein
MVGIKGGKGWNKISKEKELLIQKLLRKRKEYFENHKFTSKGVIRTRLKPTYKEIADIVGVLKQTVIIRDNPDYAKKLKSIHSNYINAHKDKVNSWSKKGWRKRFNSGKILEYRNEYFEVPENLERNRSISRVNSRKNYALKKAKEAGLDNFALKIRTEMVDYSK